MNNIVGTTMMTLSTGPSKGDIEFQEIPKELKLVQFHIQQ